MSIFVTGDIHGKPQRFNTDNFPIGKELTKDDYVVILGDFGLVWHREIESPQEKYWLDWLENKPWTTLFIDGNHENFDRLLQYPVEEWHGGKVQRLRPSVVHLMRGEIFDLNGFTALAMGGASSHDIKDGILEITDPRVVEWRDDLTKMYRINHYEWWAEELPNDAEIANAKANIAKYNNKVDFVFTHEAPASDIFFLDGGFLYKPDDWSKELEEIRATLDFKKWLFGHYHVDVAVNANEIAMYEDIMQIA